MKKKSKIPRYIHVELQLKEEGGLDEVGIYVASEDGADLTAQEIIDAVADTLLREWDNSPMQVQDESDYDA